MRPVNAFRQAAEHLRCQCKDTQMATPNTAAIPSKVPAPSGPVTLGKAPNNSSGPAGGTAQKGFSGNGLIPGKISI